MEKNSDGRKQLPESTCSRIEKRPLVRTCNTLRCPRWGAGKWGRVRSHKLDSSISSKEDHECHSGLNVLEFAKQVSAQTLNLRVSISSVPRRAVKDIREER